jgi:branched-chain amino acid transport system ATP-binding protein
MPVLSYVMLGRHQQQPGQVLRYLSGWPIIGGAEARERALAMDQLDAMGLADFAAMRMGDVPYGIAKIADLGRVLLAEPQVLLLDEPASGLSGGERLKIAEILRQFGRDPSRAVVVVEHDLILAARICDSMLVLNAGQSIAFGSPQKVLANPDVVDQLLGGAPLDELAPPEPGAGRNSPPSGVTSTQEERTS